MPDELEGLRRRREAIRNAPHQTRLLRAPWRHVIARGQGARPGRAAAGYLVPSSTRRRLGRRWHMARNGQATLADATAVTTGGQTMALSYQGSTACCSTPRSCTSLSRTRPTMSASANLSRCWPRWHADAGLHRSARCRGAQQQRRSRRQCAWMPSGSGKSPCAPAIRRPRHCLCRQRKANGSLSAAPIS